MLVEGIVLQLWFMSNEAERRDERKQYIGILWTAECHEKPSCDQTKQDAEVRLQQAIFHQLWGKLEAAATSAGMCYRQALFNATPTHA